MTSKVTSSNVISLSFSLYYWMLVLSRVYNRERECRTSVNTSSESHTLGMQLNWADWNKTDQWTCTCITCEWSNVTLLSGDIFTVGYSLSLLYTLASNQLTLFAILAIPLVGGCSQYYIVGWLHSPTSYISCDICLRSHDKYMTPPPSYPSINKICTQGHMTPHPTLTSM